MAVQRTLSIIKPDAVAKDIIGEIYRRFEAAGLHVVAAKMLHLSEEQAKLAVERAEAAGVADQVDIKLIDYRDFAESGLAEGDAVIASWAADDIHWLSSGAA